MIGAIIGDIAGSRFEFDNILHKDFELLHEDCFFTDDTVMTCAVAESIMRCGGKYDNLAAVATDTLREIGANYPRCGFGARFFHWIFGKPAPYGSLGNGSAMRISPVGDIAADEAQAAVLSDRVTEISHNHPDGMLGARVTATCIVLARESKDKEKIRQYTARYYPLDKTVAEIRRANYHNEFCNPCVPQAIQCFLESTDFEDCIKNCISIGGDSDTIAAIAGGIAEAYYGVPAELEEKAVAFLDERLQDIYCRWKKFVADKR